MMKTEPVSKKQLSPGQKKLLKQIWQPFRSLIEANPHLFDHHLRSFLPAADEYSPTNFLDELWEQLEADILHPDIRNLIFQAMSTNPPKRFREFAINPVNQENKHGLMNMLLLATHYLDNLDQEQGHHNEEVYRAYIACQRMAFACSAMYHFFYLVDYLEKNADPSLIFGELYRIALLRGKLSGLDILVDERIEDSQCRFKSKRYISNRWEPVRKAKQEALRVAEDKWSKGDPAFHDEMAHELEKCFKELSYNMLKRELKPLAKEFNRLRGVKGVKRQRRSPK